MSGGYSEYAYLKRLEVDMAIQLQMSIDDWGEKDIEERAMLVAAHNLPEWIKVLEIDAQIKESKRKNG